MVNIESEVRKNTHVEIRHPDNCEQRNKVSAPIGIQQFEPGDHQNDHSDIVTEAIFARKEIKEFSLPEPWGRLVPVVTIFSWLPKHVFMGQSPCNRGDWDRKDDEPQKLCRYRIEITH